jgi:alkylated DNA repair dioxygenase AlkB
MDPIYIEKFVTHPDDALTALSADLDWERRSDAPRSEYYCNDYGDAYTYGRGIGRRTYEAKPYHQWINIIRDHLEAHCKCVFDTVFLNRYLNQSDHLGWHSDDSPEMDDTRPVVSVSLGVEREIWIRAKSQIQTGITVASEIRKYKLAHGSAFIMPPGFQDLYQHKIPKASFMCGERISLTFRGYVRKENR